MYGDKMFRGVGYPTPLSVPVERACRSALIPADAAWFGLFMGLLETLTYEENWQQFEGGISREDAACYWQEIVDSLYASALGEGDCVSCCPLFRTDPQTGLPQISNDDGLTWDYFPQGPYDPSATTPIAPTPPPLDQGSENADKCQAAANAAAVLAQFWSDTIGTFAAGLNNTLLAVNAFLYRINNTLYHFVYPEAAQLTQALGLFEFDFSGYYDTPTLSEEQISEITCLLLFNATWTDGIVTFNFDAVRDGMVDAVGINPGVALQLLLDYIQAPGLNASGGTMAAPDADCSDCGWCYTWDFTESDGGWSSDSRGSGATYDGSQGWGDHTTGSVRGTYIHLPLAGSIDITKMSMVYTATLPTTVWVLAGRLAGDDGFTESASAGTGGSVSWTGTASVDELIAQVGNTTTGTPSGTSRITRVTVYGDGDNPFGENNC